MLLGLKAHAGDRQGQTPQESPARQHTLQLTELPRLSAELVSLAPQRGQVLNEVTELWRGGLCKAVKVKLVPRLGLGDVKCAGRIQASPCRCKYERSQIVNQAMTNSHCIHPASKPRIKRFTSCIPVKIRHRPRPGRNLGMKLRSRSAAILMAIKS